MEDKYPYKVYLGGCLMVASTEAARYPKHIELAMLDAGYVIKLNGKKLTKTDIRKEVSRG